MDNLNMNDAMMREMETILVDREIPFNAKDSHVMCFPHIINIIVQHVLTKMTSAVSDSGSDSDSESDSDPAMPARELADQRGRTQTFDSAFRADPIGLCRKLVVKLRSSGQIRDEFNSWVQTGNEKNRFKIKGKAVKLPHKEFLRDVPTRWDSCYQMIKRCIEMRPVCSYYLLLWFFSNIFYHQAIDTFLRSLSELENFRLSTKEWGVLQEFAYVLSVR